MFNFYIIEGYIKHTGNGMFEVYNDDNAISCIFADNMIDVVEGLDNNSKIIVNGPIIDGVLQVRTATF